MPRAARRRSSSASCARTSACRTPASPSRSPRERTLSRRSDTGLRRLVAAAGAALVLAGVSGCATPSSMRAGRAAERLEDFDRAVVEYEKALRARPDDMTARLSLQRAKVRAAAFHDQRARHLAGTGKLEEALIE